MPISDASVATTLSNHCESNEDHNTGANPTITTNSLTTDPQIPADRLLFETISAVSNVGLSFDIVNIVGKGLYTLTAAMFLGRVASLLVLWCKADTAITPEVPIA